MSRGEKYDCPACYIAELDADSASIYDAADTAHSDECTLGRALAALAPILPKQPAGADSPEALKNAAVYYASIGWPVFPLRPGAKLPLFPSAHDPGDPCRGECGQVGHGLWDASTDTGIVAAWWTEAPWANVGLRTGDRFDVVDLDIKQATADHPGVDGRDGFNELCNTTGVRPVVLASVHTGNGGRHLFVAPTGRGNFVAVRPGVDYRGTGGYVVAPPSRLAPDGRAYDWITPPSAALTGAAA